jgi:hypothetical protein
MTRWDGVEGMLLDANVLVGIAPVLVVSAQQRRQRISM